MTARSVIRSLYLYAFALVGLILLAIGSVRLLDMGLRAFVFTQAEAPERLMMRQPPYPAPVRTPAAAEGGDLTPEARAQLDTWLEDYERWKEQAERIDPVTARRHRDAASSLAMILVGLPFYLFHWRLIRREAASAMA